ncbi:dethiobiotin synthetase [Maridesulfovibrio ferrireducens]|uniref:ATP-dependent dethiobiotin synthetase BioD n=1 Tax=Maridesulfovibrio ferrireducens TaxID=246191 RepID=A0A1G9J8C2_9BACT|nr:dethiobiotin synthase [Maridesulfovibrio ferrireducens]SDL33827.1 dethiobiotin synthetase [Maridesulfovibrio ferrireducens]
MSIDIPGFFITGTGTDVGKTVVTAGLARLLQNAGYKVLPVKPVQSGGIKTSLGKLDSPDGDVYKSAGAVWDIDKQCPYIFEPACSPHLAARLSGVELEVGTIAEKVKSLEGQGTLLVEGAGGILVPLNGESTMMDLMKELSYPVLLVAGNKLGTINDTLLSLTVLKQAGINVAGVIMTSSAGPEPSEFGMAADNIRSIEDFSGVKVLASIPYISNWNPDELRCWAEVDRALAEIDLNSLANN